MRFRERHTLFDNDLETLRSRSYLTFLMTFDGACREMRNDYEFFFFLPRRTQESIKSLIREDVLFV